ncbi:MAG TPA: bidirectional hydrogenase complex protein HoxU [Vicinamibacteria bacterium]|nr:bidirectional hydrogenase complex protein HoxU [Vicinamibacteria bacterium]
MSVKTFTLDGQPVSAAEGQTILEVADEAGIAIPRLCHLDGLSDVGACRLCLVEVSGSSKLQPACLSTAEEGMAVLTDSPRLRAYRRMIVELLFAERNHVCAICEVNGHCDLQALGQSLGMDHVRFPFRSPALEIDASHHRFTLDHNRCVLCTRCVRVCDEIEGAHTWDVARRGEAARVITDLNRPWGESASCTECGKCVQACPTGALYEKIRTHAGMVKSREFLGYLKVARERGVWRT